MASSSDLQKSGSTVGGNQEQQSPVEEEQLESILEQMDQELVRFGLEGCHVYHFQLVMGQGGGSTNPLFREMTGVLTRAGIRGWLVCEIGISAVQRPPTGDGISKLCCTPPPGPGCGIFLCGVCSEG